MVLKIYIWSALIIPILVFGHEDKSYISSFDNITLRFTTADSCEELSNSRIIGKYASILSDSLNYSLPVFIDLYHSHGAWSSSEIFSYVSFGSESYKNYFFPSDRNDELIEYPVEGVDKRDKLIVRQFSSHFDQGSFLRLLEYAILNRRSE